MRRVCYSNKWKAWNLEIWNSRVRKPSCKSELRFITSLNWVKWKCDVIASFWWLGIFNENEISESRDSETLLLLDNAKILESHNSKILVSLKVPSYVTPESYLSIYLSIYLFIYLFISKFPSHYFKNYTTIHLTRKFLFWVVNRC